MARKIEIPENSYVVLVTGDRNWTDEETVRKVLSRLPTNAVIVHGYAVGLDTIAHIEGIKLGLGVIPCPAHWRHNEPKCVQIWGPCEPDCMEIVGRPAGAIRNRWMYNTYRPSIVLGFHNNIMESRGTKDMLKVALKGGTEAWLYTSAGDEIQNPPLTQPRKSSKLKEVDVADKFFDWQ